jgi:hypothetical protein
MEANRAFSSSLYNDLKATLPTVDKQAINPQATKITATALLARYPDLFKQFQDTKTEKLLKNITAGLKDTKPTQNALLNPDLSKKVTFDDLWQLRDGLGDLIGKAKKKLNTGDVDKSQISQLNALYKSVYSDIDNWASSIGQPQISKAVKTANEGYKKYVVKYDLLQRAYDKAAGAEGAGKMFSPQTFSTQLNKLILKDKTYKSFDPNEIQQMTGLANIMQVVKRAGQYMENPPTGNRLTLPVLGEIAKEAGFLASLPITGLAKLLTTTQRGQNLALAASKLNPNSQGMALVIRALAKEGFNAKTKGEQ